MEVKVECYASVESGAQCPAYARVDGLCLEHAANHRPSVNDDNGNDVNHLEGE